MASFPAGIPSFTGFVASHTLAADSHAAQHNSEQAEVVAIATKIGTGSSTPISSTVLRGTGSGVSSWAQVDLSSDVTGILPTNRGGNGTSSTTGTGASVFQTSPTLDTPQINTPSIGSGGSWSGSPSISTPTITVPTIASFASAQHDHSNGAGGGALGTSTVNSTMLAPLIAYDTNGTGTVVNAGTDYAISTVTFTVPTGGLMTLWVSLAARLQQNSAMTNTFDLKLDTVSISSPHPGKWREDNGTANQVFHSFVTHVTIPNVSAGSHTLVFDTKASSGNNSDVSGEIFVIGFNV